MKKYQYLASWDDQTLTRVGEPVVVLGDSNVSQVEVILPSNFLLDPTKAECRMYFLLPGEKESAHDVLETAVKDENGDSHVTWTIKHVHSQKGGRLAFSLTLIGDDAQWDSRTAIIPVYESRYQPESEEAEEPYTGRLDALEGSMASIRGEFTEVQEDFEKLKETATLGTPIPESLVANMTEGRVYIYTGTEPGYTAGHVYYYVGGTLTDGGVYGGTAVDATLTQSGQAADAAAVGAEVSAIKEDLSVGLSALALGNRLLIKKLVFSDGYWNTSGVLTPSITTFHTEKMELIQGHQYYVEFPTTTTKIIMRNFNSDGTVAGSSERTTSGIFIPTTNTIAFNGLGDPKADDIYLFDNETSLLTSDEFATSTNALDPHFIEINRGRYMRPDGTMGSGDLYAYSGKINVSEGDVIYSVINGENTGSFRFVTAYDMDDRINAEVGKSTTVNSYTVPANISAVRVTILLSEYDGKEYAVNINKVYPYEPYFSDTKVPFENRVFFNSISNNADGVKKANTDIKSLASSITEKPLSTMPDYVVNTLAYKPMAKPSKGYICLVSDDGKLGLATYAIPMVINKAVPLTLAVMSSSEVFRQGNSIKNVILDAVNNHGCEIAQHGGINWTEYTEQTLNKYFDNEKAFFDGLGLSVKSAVIPSHYTTPLIQAIAGGRYGVVRSGYRGHNAQGTGVTIYDYYDYYTSGEFSNLYGLSSFNIKDSLAGNKAAIDYANDNNKVVIMYWHESGLTDADKVTLETTIDYAKDKGLEFITLSVLKHLIDHERTI